MTRIRIDPDRCVGHTRCFAIAPELIELDELGQASVRGGGVVPPELLEKARLAVANCPEFALTLEEDSP